MAASFLANQNHALFSVGCFSVLVILLGLSDSSLAQNDLAPAPLDDPVEAFVAWQAEGKLAQLADEKFAKVALTRAQADAAAGLIWQQYRKTEKSKFAAQWQAKEIVSEGKKMRFDYKLFGKKPQAGWDLYISMHGGGGAPAKLNDQQWKNQIGLYSPQSALYVAPRAPTNTWNLWHQAHVDAFFDTLIEGAVVHMGANVNRVFLMGYSAGGDGVYQLAPRMADRFAAASMMAGHPNETSPLGLRNLPFCIHMGAKDTAYKRNQIAAQWKKKLAGLEAKDRLGYKHQVTIHAGMEHWMERKDAVALEWMSEFTRTTRPKRVVWKQDDVGHEEFYWLSMPKPEKNARPLVIAEVKKQSILIKHADVEILRLRLDDRLLDLDQPIHVKYKNKTLFKGRLERTIANLADGFLARPDPERLFSAVLSIRLKKRS